MPADLPAFRREWDDDYLSGVLDQEQAFRSARRVIEENHLGYRIVMHRGRLFALPPSCSHLHSSKVGETEMKRLQQDGECFIADALATIKEQVARHVNELRLAPLEAVEADLLATRERMSRQDERLNDAINALHRLEGQAFAFRPKNMPLCRLSVNAGGERCTIGVVSLGGVPARFGISRPPSIPSVSSRP